MEDEFDVDVDVQDDMEDDMGDAYDYMGMGDDLEDPTGLEESLKNKVNKTLKKYFKKSQREKGRELFNESANRSYIRKQISKTKKVNDPITLSETIEQELKAKKVLKSNKNIKFIGKTKNSTIVFEGKHRRLGVTKHGQLVR